MGVLTFGFVVLSMGNESRRRRGELLAFMYFEFEAEVQILMYSTRDVMEISIQFIVRYIHVNNTYHYILLSYQLEKSGDFSYTTEPHVL